MREVALLDYLDGELDRADPAEAVGRIVAQLRRVRPQVVVTFDPFGACGHPDHVAICQLTTAAVLAAADPGFPGEGAPHRTSKPYQFVTNERRWAVYQSVFERLTSTVDGQERAAVAWPDWAVSATIDTRSHWQTVWSAVRCHATQLAVYAGIAEPPEQHEALWGSETLYRVLSVVDGGRARETDLFEGLR